MGCPPVRGYNPRASASGLSYVEVDKHGLTILYHLLQCRPAHHERFRAEVVINHSKGIYQYYLDVYSIS